MFLHGSGQFGPIKFWCDNAHLNHSASLKDLCKHFNSTYVSQKIGHCRYIFSGMFNQILKPKKKKELESKLFN